MTSGYLAGEFGIHSFYPVRLPAPRDYLERGAALLAASSARELVRRAWLRRRSRLIAVVAHAGCTRSPGAPDEQIEALCEGVERISRWCLPVDTVGLWIDESGAVDWLA